jgi:hypothetical protein
VVHVTDLPLYQVVCVEHVAQAATDVSAAIAAMMIFFRMIFSNERMC